MLDIPSLGRDYLTRALKRVAEDCDDADTYEGATEILTNCLGMVNKTELKRALTETSENSKTYVTRECDVQRSALEVFTVKRMMA
jgi:hypothetical protein